MVRENNKVTKGNKECRIFVQDIRKQAWQLFSIGQNKKEGSIYLSSPEFTSFEWLALQLEGDTLQSIKIQQDEEGHLSFHSSGQVHVRNHHSKKYKLSSKIPGQYLLKPEERNISLRHLFTLFPRKPKYTPNSKALNRKSDQIIMSKEVLKPFFIVAFALPRIGLNINFQTSFNIHDLENVPHDILGIHLFPLIHHDIFMLFYKTKNLNKWANKNMLQYFDGIRVPVFIGKPDRSIYVEFRVPEYKLNDKDLQIKL